MLEGVDTQQAAMTAGGVGGTIIGAAFFFRSIFAKWIGLGTAIDSENARKEIVELLREQIDELVDLNKELREENKILREERLASQEENSQLKIMVRTLETKVEFLQRSIDKLRKEGYNSGSF